MAFCTLVTGSTIAASENPRGATSTGPATLRVTVRAWSARWMTTSSFTGAAFRSDVEGVDDALDHEVPAVDEDEEEDLEGEGDDDRGGHHHPHGNEHRRDDQVDDEEGQVNQK